MDAKRVSRKGVQYVMVGIGCIDLKGYRKRGTFPGSEMGNVHLTTGTKGDQERGIVDDLSIIMTGTCDHTCAGGSILMMTHPLTHTHIRIWTHGLSEG